MSDAHRIDIESPDDELDAEEAAETVSEEDVDIRTAIDEAVHAIEVAEQRRGQSAVAAEGEVDAVAGSGGEIERLQAEVDTLRDRSLRTLADFDNFRKRAEREREEERKYAAVELLREVLGIVDNLERALSAQGSLDDLKEGVEMILRQMSDLLERAGVSRVEALNQEFDPSVHEAVSRVEDPDVEHATVIDEFQPGYVVHGRLLRPSIVRVAVPSSESAGTSASGDGTSSSTVSDEDTEEAAN